MAFPEEIVRSLGENEDNDFANIIELYEYCTSLRACEGQPPEETST